MIKDLFREDLERTYEVIREVNGEIKELEKKLTGRRTKRMDEDAKQAIEEEIVKRKEEIDNLQITVKALQLIILEYANEILKIDEETDKINRNKRAENINHRSKETSGLKNMKVPSRLRAKYGERFSEYAKVKLRDLVKERESKATFKKRYEMYNERYAKQLKEMKQRAEDASRKKWFEKGKITYFTDSANYVMKKDAEDSKDAKRLKKNNEKTR